FGRLVLGSKVDKSQLEPFTIGLMNTFSKNKFQLPKSLRILKKAAIETETELEKDYDIIMTSVTTKTTPKIGYFSPTLDYEEIARRAADFATFLPLFNISGSPALSLPMGVASDDMPVGVQFVAPHGQDALLLELALQLEQAQPWRHIYNR
ncbi:MAG TPA: amidase family protein, partial [Chitinophagales bacterium]|nr:amidase family protein [Chitinophagales bacterium]